MPEILCSGCGKKLRVPDVRAGQKAKCPSCNTIFVVPHAGPAAGAGMASAPTAPNAPQTSDRWTLKTAEGEVFGPISKMELDSWVAQGRVTAQSQVLQEGSGQWQWASDIYPVLATSPAAPVPGGGSTNPFADIGERRDSNPYMSPHGSTIGQHGRYRRPHRGGMILAFAILGWAFCAVFGIMAWVMGNADLREMRAGRMDRSGMGLTQAGMVIGMIQCILLMIAVPIYLLVFFAAVAGN